VREVYISEAICFGIEYTPFRFRDPLEAERAQQYHQASETAPNEIGRHGQGRAQSKSNRERLGLALMLERDGISVSFVEASEQIAQQRRSERRHVAPGDQHERLGRRFQTRDKAHERTAVWVGIANDANGCDVRGELDLGVRSDDDDHFAACFPDGANRVLEERASVHRFSELVAAESSRAPARQDDARGSNRLFGGPGSAVC
jgi:hypothetical protein